MSEQIQNSAQVTGRSLTIATKQEQNHNTKHPNMLRNFQQYKQQRQDEETTMKLQGTKRPGNYCEQYKQKRQNQSDPIQ